MSNPMFQTRQLNAIAADFAREFQARRANRDESGLHALRSLALSMASTFERDNPRFQRARFLDACGVECEPA